MGSPLGPLMANAFMCKLEEELKELDSMPRYYRRYVDDTLALFDDATTGDEFFEKLNNIHPNLTFTKEDAENQSIPFIGIRIQIVNSQFRTSIYHKSTDKGLYLHFQSFSDEKYKRSLVWTMINRAYTLSSDWSAIHDEINYLSTCFRKLNYPANLFEKSTKRFVNSKFETQPAPEKTDLIPILLPYKGKDAATVLRRDLNVLNNILKRKPTPVFTSTKLSSIVKLKEEKPKMLLDTNVVYKFECSCNKSYIGYTCRFLHIRIEEHLKSNSSSIFRHAKLCGHTTCASDFSILAKLSSPFDCRIREALEISVNKPELNVQSDCIKTLLY